MSRDPRRFPGIVLLACLALALAGLPPDAVLGASLQLDAPPGAVVSIDGRRVGTVPLSESTLLEPGAHTVRLDMPGAHSAVADLQVGADEAIVHVTMRLAPKSRWNAAGRSVLLAGMGQQYLDRPKLGWALTITEVGAVAVAGLAQLRFVQSEDDYNEARARYDTVLDPGQLEAARVDARDAYDDMGSAESMRNVALVVAGAAVVASAMDAWFRFPQLQLGSGSAPSNVSRIGADGWSGPVASTGGSSARDGAGLHLLVRTRF